MKKIFLIMAVLAAAFKMRAQSELPKENDGWKKLYRETSTRVNDLIHTKMEARFYYAKAYMYGKAWITLKPHFYATDSLLLDAKGMDIAKLALVNGNNTSSLKYSYDGSLINIKLDKTYKGGEEYTIYIDYTAKPNELKVKGSAAINDAKGLYFVNPKGEDKDKPTQIWTQGETEATSVWCPTIDRPNQKSTSEFYLTVPDKYVSLSNGLLISQKKNNDGTRTDYWKMDMPHAPYLFFMGVGDFAVIKEAYRGKEVSYYVEKEYAPVAKKIFGNTPEMMGFFSRITGVDYPWQKYSQMVARDYVSGAMENTTATLHQEAAQQDARELIDGNGWESIIAHELFHQWFGDYVTAESWSNLTVNESFANYSEVLWDEYKYGKDAGDAKNYNDMQDYLASRSEAKDLVRFRYSDKEDMFDAVSYNKGGRILHMLRNYLGDSAFFKGLNNYLNTNKFKSGEAHQLRLAFEEVSGRDLNWYFNQWYFGSGHPIFYISYEYNDTLGKATVTIKQTQDGDKVFRLPIAIDVYNGKDKVRRQVWIENKTETFTFNYTKRPDLINVDADKILLCDKKDDKTLENFIHQYKYAGNYVDRREAVEYVAEKQTDPKALDVLKLALKDKFFQIRKYALEKLDLKKSTVQKEVEPIIADLAKSDTKSTVRSAAIGILSTYQKAEYKPLFVKAINDSSYSVAGEALAGLTLLDNTTGLAEAKRLSKGSMKGKLAETISQIYMEMGTEDDFDMIAGNFKKIPMGQSKFEALQPFGEYLAKVNNTEKLKKGVDLIVEVRDNIPASYQAQTTPFINNLVLKSIIASKKKSLTTQPAFQQQIDYINSKLSADKKGF
jgi:aminopeptidase N